MWWGKEITGELGTACCGCAGHAMEQRPHPDGYIAWWCFTCNAWQTGCKR